MLFNSYQFIFVFLPIALSAFFLLARFRLTNLATASLVVASLIFYAYWDLRYLPLLLASILFNFYVGQAIERAVKLAEERNTHAKEAAPTIETASAMKVAERFSKGSAWENVNFARRLLAFGVVVDLGLLGYFKYTNFFLDSVNTALGLSLANSAILLPLGISFFTFTQLAYLVDAYRGETKNYTLLTYALFVTFFPHLIAGPILHHADIIPQFQRLRNFLFSHKNMALGITMFTLGLGKKVLIADTLSQWVKPLFEQANNLGMVEAWAGALAYTFQLYFDFSGYSDMAIGLGLMLNIKLPLNFNSPYKATSIIDFWRRWHISLSTFLKDYLYIPLGGSRHGHWLRMRNLLVTMLLGGLWHGAGWTFVVWGAWHGLSLVVNHTWRKLGVVMPAFLGWLMTFVAVVIGWVFFRAASMAEALAMLKAMAGFNGVNLPPSWAAKLTFLSQGSPIIRIEDFVSLPDAKLKLACLFLLILWTAFLPNTQQWLERFKPTWRWAVAVGVLFAFSLLNLNKVTEFLYFQF